MRQLIKLLTDAIGLWRVCGPSVSLRWLYHVALNIPSIVRTGNLQSADHALGPGPFRIALEQCASRFVVTGESAIGGIREMYVRDVYLRGGWLRINDGDTVLDLGANMGNFTNMALASGPSVRVVAVEPSIEMNRVFLASVGRNVGHLERVQLVRAFLGKACNKHQQLIAENNDYSNAPWISEDELVHRADLRSIDLIKCDIEGGEFGLLTPSSKLLQMAKAIAIEVHSFAGNVNSFIGDLEGAGFLIGPIQRDSDGTVTLLAKRRWPM